MKKEQSLRGHSLVQFFLKRVFIILILALVCLLGFLLSNAMMNCIIIAQEGIEIRADYILGGPDADINKLERFFTQRYIDSDDMDKLHEKYTMFKINRFSHSSNIDSISVWPGSTNANIIISENITRIQSEYLGEGTAQADEWENGTYQMSMVYVDGKWLIDSITLIKAAQKPIPTPTPKPEITTSPEATPTPHSSP